jgi:hypothetical protein
MPTDLNQQSKTALLLYGRPAADLENDGTHGLGEGSIDRATAGAFVAAAAEAFGYVGDVDFAFTSQAYTVASVG